MMITLKILLSFFILLFIICIGYYIGVPQYRFAAGQRFAGSSIYNPYLGIDSTLWQKANFHSHQREKPKCDYSTQELVDAYHAKGYDIIQISDHQYINREQENIPGYIPTYEHGLSWNKFHQLIIGVDNVAYRDFPIMTTKSQIQNMLHYLRNDGDLLVLNHPGQLRVVNHNIYAVLRGYDLLEINPQYDQSTKYWDMALSQGIYSNLIGNDDAHSISNRKSWFQRAFTMLNTPSLKREDVVNSLRKGSAYGVVVTTELNMRDEPHSGFASIKDIGMRADTVFISLSEPASVIRFVGQDGTVMDQVENVQNAEYLFQPSDSYIRVEAVMANGLGIFSNPFVRTDNDQPKNPITAEIAILPTILMNILYVVLVLLLSVAGCRVWGLKLKLFQRSKNVAS